MSNNITITPEDSTDVIVEKIKTLDGTTKDAIYRALWMDYVMDDINSRIEEMELDDAYDESDVKAIAERYVYDGKYDCELSYWDNIENLIDGYKS